MDEVKVTAESIVLAIYYHLEQSCGYDFTEIDFDYKQQIYEDNVCMARIAISKLLIDERKKINE